VGLDAQVFLIRNPPNKKYRIRLFKRTQPKNIHGPTHALGTIIIQGIARGSSSIPDSPESAGFFDAMKNNHEKATTAKRRNKPAATIPPRENLIVGFNIVPPQV
jgi:hypothetical protein